MSSRGSRRIDRYLDSIGAGGGWPGACFAIGPPGGEPEIRGATGRRSLSPSIEANDASTLYDLASLTKPLVTAVLAARLAGRGLLDLDAPLAALLPELNGYAGRTPTMRDLLLHRSGLPSWRPVYRSASASDSNAVMSVMGDYAPAAPAGSRAEYGCLGPISAGIAIERLTGRGLDELFRTEVVEPSGLSPTELSFGPLDGPTRSRAAPTESGRKREAHLAGQRDSVADLEQGSGKLLRGVVHDGNAAFLGGVAGNAGLFGTASAVFRVASRTVFPGGLVDDDVVAQMARPWSGHDGAESRTFGFQAGEDSGAPCGRLGRASFGHTGFTGTSLWISHDPPIVAVLLTNRVHPVWRDDPIQAWRSGFHDIAHEVLCEDPA